MEQNWANSPQRFFNIPLTPVLGAANLKDFVGPEVASLLHPFWWNFPPLETIYILLFGLLYVVGGILAIAGNFVVLVMFTKYDALRKPANILIMNLAFCDLMMMVTLVPESAYGLFVGGQWPFGNSLCQFHAYCGALFGFGQILTLVFISHDRYTVIVKGIGAKPLTMGRVKLILTFIWCYSFFWASAPLVGFGGYALDGVIVSCSYDYMNRDPTNVKYFIGIFTFCFVIPLTFIMGFYYNIVKAVWAHEAVLREQAKKMNVASLRSNEDAQKTSTEIRIAKVAITNVALWLSAWVPFAIIALIGVIGNQELLTPTSTLIPTMMSKLSCIYNPIIYAISHPKYRQCLKKAFPYFCCCIKEEVRYDNQSTASEITKIADP